MGRAVSVNFASFLAGGLKQAIAGAQDTVARHRLTRSSLVFHLTKLPGVTLVCRRFRQSGTMAKGTATHNENNIADPAKDRRVNIQ